MVKKINNLLNSNLFNLIILLILVCVIYQILMYFKKDNYQTSSFKLVKSLDEIGYAENGFTIQVYGDTEQKYLSHKEPNSKINLNFDTTSLKKTKINGYFYDTCRFFFEESGNEGYYFIKSSGPVDPAIGDTYISTDSDIRGLINLKPNIGSRSKAKGFKFQSTDTDFKFRINNVSYTIKPYVPDTANALNEYNINSSIEQHQSLAQNKCNTNKLLEIKDTPPNKVEDCFKHCDNRSDCNYFQYYYKNKGDDIKGGTCVLFSDCKDNLETGGENSVIYQKTDIREKMLRERENRYRILGVKNKNYLEAVKLIEENKSKAKEITDTIKQIDDIKHYAPGHSQKIVNEHKEIVDLIEDPSRIASFKHKIEQDIQDMKIEDLEKNMAKLEELRIKNNMKLKLNTSQEIHGIKSFDNSQILNVYPGSKKNYNKQGGKNYMIFGNEGCLSFNQVVDDKGISNQYAFTHCNVQNPQQQFKIKKIDNKSAYNNTVYSDNDKINSDSEFINYGFNIIKPVNMNNKADYDNQNKHCLSLSDSGLSVEPCTLESKQRFSTVNNITAC